MTRFAQVRNNRLDREFIVLTKPIMNELKIAERGALGAALKAMDTEAKRLDKVGLKFSMGDPAVLLALYEYQSMARLMQHAMHRQTGAIAASGAQTAVDMVKLAVGNPSGWHDPLPDAIIDLIRMTTGSKWADLLSTFGASAAEIARIVATGIQQGKGPIAIASILSKQIGYLRSVAENIARTLQLVAYRDAGAATRAANADILEPYAIRIAVLDGRTCVACIGLHGTRIPFNEPVVDHWSGRCDAIPVTKGRVINIQSGEEWLRSLPTTQQSKGAAYQQQIGYANWNAWQQGKVSLSDFGQVAIDSTFKEMLKVASLKGLLGDAAKTFYKSAS